jgi:hypothetical protein
MARAWAGTTRIETRIKKLSLKWLFHAPMFYVFTKSYRKY